MPLFAEVPEWVMFASTTAGGAAVWLATWITTRRKEARAERKEDEKGIVDHQSELIERQTAAISDLQGRCDRLNDTLTKVLSHMGYLEGILAGKGIEFQRFNLDGTDVHRSLREAGR